MRILQKIILLICLIIPVSGFAALNENIDKVFQINAYTIDSDTQVYYPIQYGSSVYIGKNQILTNAHVVLDYKDQPIGNYEVCKTLNFKQKPICFSVAKLLYFDIKNDLALLEISNPNVAAIQLNNKDLSLGETVKVLGYPSNGGDTISYTEGKISGYTDGLYKIDANIDSGNSGGGVFDSEGNLIGLSVSVMVGYSTMGYVIPVSTINEFVSQKKTSNITQYSNGISSSFLKYFHYKEKLIGSTSYNDPYVQFKNLQKYGFKVSDIHQNISGELFETQFLNNDTKIYIYNDIIYGGKYDIEEDVKAASKIFQEYKQKNIIQDYRVEMMKLFGKKTIFVYNKYNKDSTLFTFIIETQENHRINIQIRNSSGKIDKTIIQAFKMVLLDMNLTGKTLPHNPLKNDIISDFVVGDYQDIQIGKNVSGVNFVDIDYNMESLATKFGTYFSFFEPNDTLEFIFNALPIIGDYDMDNELENVMIKKTKSNLPYLYLSGEGGDETKDIVAIFILKKDDEYVEWYFEFQNVSLNEEETIHNFLDNLSLKNPKQQFKSGNLKFDVNIIDEVYLGDDYDWSDYDWDDEGDDIILPNTSTQTQLYIDNPTKRNISLQIGNDIFLQLSNYQSKVIDIIPGKYPLYVDDVYVGEVNIKNDEKGFLNPTGAFYIKEYLIYTYLAEDETDYDILPETVIKMHGQNYYGPFELYKGYYISGDWDYGIDEEFPEAIQLDDGLDQDMRSKLYRYDDFLELYEMYYES